MTSRLLNTVSRTPLSFNRNALTSIIKRAESTIPYNSKVKKKKNSLSLTTRRHKKKK